MIIPENSKVQFKLHGVGSDDIIKTCEASKDIEVVGDAITFIDNGLFVTSPGNPVEKVDDKTFIVNVWLQDAYCVKDNMFYESISDAD